MGRPTSKRLPDRPGFTKIERKWPENYDLDLGDGHYLSFSYGGIPKEDGVHRHDDPITDRPVGGIIYHHRDANPRGYCSGGITFDVPYNAKLDASRPKWQVQTWEPLTCSPSFLCHCGDHGFIREGKWVRA